MCQLYNGGPGVHGPAIYLPYATLLAQHGGAHRSSGLQKVRGLSTFWSWPLSVRQDIIMYFAFGYSSRFSRTIKLCLLKLLLKL